MFVPVTFNAHRAFVIVILTASASNASACLLDRIALPPSIRPIQPRRRFFVEQRDPGNVAALFDVFGHDKMGVS